MIMQIQTKWFLFFLLPLLASIGAFVLVALKSDKFWQSVFDWLETGMD